MIRHFIPITFLQRDVISNEHPTKDLPLSLSSSLERARQGGNELEGNNFCCFFARPPFSLGESPMVDRTWRWRSSANFVRYTVEIFSLDFGWKARVNEFGKGLVNIRWLLNLCTRVNKYCACGTQEIREPEIVPAIYTYVYISDPIYFSIFLNPLFFLFLLLISYFWEGKWFKLLPIRSRWVRSVMARVSSMRFFILL